MAEVYHMEHLKSIEQSDNSAILMFELPSGEQQICRIVDGPAPKGTSIGPIACSRQAGLMPDSATVVAFIETDQPLGIVAQTVWKGRVVEQMLGMSESLYLALQTIDLPVSTIDGVTIIYNCREDDD